MFVGWIRGSFEKDLEQFSKEILCDKNLLIKSRNAHEDLCFAAYNNDHLIGVITAYEFDKTLFINNFYYQNGVSDEIKSRLIQLLLTNIVQSDKSIMILAKEDEKPLFEAYGFKSHSTFNQALYNGGGVAFNFSNATAKSINRNDYINTLKTVDAKAYSEDRLHYITQMMMKQSSLLLSTTFGYQHSYALGKQVIKISPWIMEDGAFDDAEKLLRGVIYHRGLKKILSFIPSGVDEITKLYQSYKFDITDKLHLMYKNQKPTINLEMIYGF